MDLKRIGLIGLAAAVVVGCDSGDGAPVSSNPIQITPQNAPAVAADGVALAEGTADLADLDEVGPPISVEISGVGGKPRRGLNLSAIANIVRGHLDAATGADLGLPALPIAAVMEPASENCGTSGTRTISYTEGAWDIVYDQCLEEQTEGDYPYSYLIDGRTSGTYTYGEGDGQWSADYDNFAFRYAGSEGPYTWRYKYMLDGQFNSSWSYDEGVGTYVYNYGATDLFVSYDYAYSGSKSESESAAGNIIYDAYQFDYYGSEGSSTWSGNLQARDSRRGAWYIATPVPFTTNWCAGTVSGEMIFAGEYFHYGHDDNGDSDAPAGNMLKMTGNGDETVTYNVYSDGTLISSRTDSWFGDYNYCDL